MKALLIEHCLNNIDMLENDIYLTDEHKDELIKGWKNQIEAIELSEKRVNDLLKATGFEHGGYIKLPTFKD